MAYDPITELDYDNIYIAVSQLVIDNSANIETLLNNIKQAFNITVPLINDKSYYVNENDRSSKIRNLRDMWNYTNKNVERTAEILFGAWYTVLTIMAFHGICATKIRKCIEEVNLKETWYIELSDSSFDERTFIIDILEFHDRALNVGHFNPKYTEDQVNITLYAPKVFKESTLADVLQGNILVNLTFWRHETMYYDIDDAPLNSVGKIIKEHFLAREQALIRERSI